MWVLSINWTDCSWYYDYKTVMDWNNFCCYNYWDAVSAVVSVVDWSSCFQINKSDWISFWKYATVNQLFCDWYPLVDPFISAWQFCIWPKSNNTNSMQLNVDIQQPEVPWLVPWWVSAFSWVVSSLVSSVGEFIPYVSYIWFWILGSVIWFFAIKWLIVRVRRKIFWSFKS